MPAAPRGVPQVEVTFDIDANGIVNVSAKDTATGKEQAITITASSGLSDGEIDNMVRESESHADEDKKNREQIEARNQLDSMIYNTEKVINENRDKLPADEIANVENAIAEGKNRLEGGSAEEMKAAGEKILQASHKIAEILYKAQTAGAGPAAGPEAGPEAGAPGPAAEGEVIDAEYEDGN